MTITLSTTIAVDDRRDTGGRIVIRTTRFTDTVGIVDAVARAHAVLNGAIHTGWIGLMITAARCQACVDRAYVTVVTVGVRGAFVRRHATTVRVACVDCADVSIVTIAVGRAVRRIGTRVGQRITSVRGARIVVIAIRIRLAATLNRDTRPRSRITQFALART